MSTFRNIGIGVGIVGLILLWISPLLGVVFIAAAIGIPVAAYFMLDPSQRRRLRRVNQRKQIGR